MMAQNPDHLKICWDAGRGEPQLFVGPELIDYMQKLCLPEAPEGWMTLEELAEEIKRPCDMVQDLIALMYGRMLDKDMASYKTAGGRCCPHYAPGICAMVKSRTLPPENWMDIPELAERIGTSPLR